MSLMNERSGNPGMFLTAEFVDSKSVAAAIEDLKGRAFDPDDLDVFSAEPVELPAGVLDRSTRMSFIAVVGAATVCLLAVAFVGFTQHHLRVVTGGMPLFSFWATGVIFYEFTLLGAIAATFLMFLWESGLLRRNATGPVPALDTGRIYLRVRCFPKEAAAAGESLYRAGAATVKRTEAAS